MTLPERSTGRGRDASGKSDDETAEHSKGALIRECRATGERSRFVSLSRDAGGNEDEGIRPGSSGDGEGKSGRIQGVEEGEERLGVVTAELGFAEPLDENQGVRGGVGVGGEEVGFVVAGIVGVGNRNIWSGIGASGEDVEDGPFREDSQRGVGRGVGADPIQSRIETISLVARSQTGTVVDGIRDVPLPDNRCLKAEGSGNKTEEEGGGNRRAVVRTGMAECQQEGAAEGRQSQNEAVKGDRRVEKHLGD